MQEIIKAITPGLAELVGLALTGIIAWLANTARAKWGVEITARHREALHSALWTGAQLALERKLTGASALELIKSYVRQSVPGAIAALNPTTAVLTDLAKAKLEEASKGAAQVVGTDRLAEAMRKALAG